MVLRPVRAVHHGDGDIFAVARHSYAFGCLANADCIYDARGLRFEVDDVDNIDVALPSALVAEHRNITLGADLKAVRPDAADHECFTVLDLVAVDGENRNPMISIASDQGALSVRRERNMTWSGLRIAELNLTGRRKLVARRP